MELRCVYILWDFLSSHSAAVFCRYKSQSKMVAERHSDFSQEVLRHWPGSACDWLDVVANSAAANVTRHWIIIASVQHWHATLKKKKNKLTCCFFCTTALLKTDGRNHSNQTLFIFGTLIQNALKNQYFFVFLCLKGFSCVLHTLRLRLNLLAFDFSFSRFTLAVRLSQSVYVRVSNPAASFLV